MNRLKIIQPGTEKARHGNGWSVLTAFLFAKYLTFYVIHSGSVVGQLYYLVGSWKSNWKRNNSGRDVVE